MTQKNQLFPATKPFPLNSAQKAAAEAPKTPLLIVAGAGTGKTRTLTSRIIHLMATGTPPRRICAITFTNKAAKEMVHRLPGNPELSIGTFHSLGARILRRECRAFGRTPNFVIFDDHDSFDLIKKIVKKHGLTEKDKKNTPSFFAQKISEMKNLDAARVEKSILGESDERADRIAAMNRTSAAAERAAPTRLAAERLALVNGVYEEYEAALARNNAFDFDDLIEKPVALWRRDPAALKKYQQAFDAVLVDEYQDINPKQYEFVKLLAEAHRNLSVVGDDEQTIYSWRYADIRTFLNFDKDWPGAAVHFLEENYRSTQHVIQAAQAVAEHNRFRTPKTLRTANPEGEPIALFEAWGENDEAAWIVEQIKERRRTGSTLSECAILYRTNAQSRAIEQALIRHDLPYQIFGGLKFYERREVKDAVAALRWVMNARDELARERLEKNLTKRKFAVFQAKAANLSAPTPAETLKLFLESFGYFDYLEDNFTNADEREENIAELMNFAAEFKDLPDLMEKISLLQATDDESAAAARDGKKSDKVNLMTIHLAKGLEFDNVFIAGVSEGLLPHVRSIDHDDSLEEERRLMYVAMTRARKKLHVSFYGMPSRFIEEIPQEHLVLLNAAPDSAAHDGSSQAEDYRGGLDDFQEENVIQW